jgi:hypothetical protein
VKEIPLTQGKVARVDDADYELVAGHSWWALQGRTAGNERWYAVTQVKRRTIYMHRLILGLTDPEVEVDHIDHDGLNNQRANLRLCSQFQNNGNGRTQGTPKSSKYKGVSWVKRDSFWIAYIQVHKRIYLGSFHSEEAAAIAYDNAARKYFGDFAETNFPASPPPTANLPEVMENRKMQA